MATGWIRVRHGRQCPICESETWCTVSADGTAVHCMRAESDKPVESKKVGGWIHKLGESKVVRFTRAEKEPEQRPVIRWTDEAQRMYEAGRAAKTRQELAEGLGVTVESLELLRVGWGADFAEFSSFPMRNMRQRVCGIVRRYEDGRKLTMKWSRPGLFHALEWLDFGGPVFLPEGASDVAALLSMNLCAVGRPSNTGGIAPLVSLLTGVKRTVIVLAERDEKPHKRGHRTWCPAECKGCAHCFPGKFGSETTAQQLTEALGRRVQCRFPPDGAKDVREWVKEHGLNGGKFLSGLRSH